MKILKNLLFISGIVLLLSSCSGSHFTLGCPDGEIEWADMLLIDDIQYQHHFPEPANESLPLTIEKGKELGKVAYKLADNACSNHKMKNGDAAFLKEGTIIYEIKGYPTSLIVVANELAYVANRNKKAETAGELYPMDQLVKDIHIESTEDGKRLHTFSQSSKDKFLAEFHKLKLEDVDSSEGSRVFLEIELNNGVSFRQVYWRGSNTFSNGAIGNDEIKEVIHYEASNISD